MKRPSKVPSTTTKRAAVDLGINCGKTHEEIHKLLLSRKIEKQQRLRFIEWLRYYYGH